ncbi:hypothetical protein [Flavobacterium sp. RS13.1]|jgi:hypothetical protein|uniref:hypothetical protein n=1 Tax=Flavobacterium sp. RS13.1 TaxID=3400345 RepID=UPI003AAF192C
MISQIGIDEFRKRLELNTKLGNPKISGTPFHAFNMVGEKNKLFFGRLNQNDFKITSNAILYPIPFILKGEIRYKSTNQTEVTYQITPISFGYYWIRYFPFIIFFIINIIFIIHRPPIIVCILFNSFLIIIGIISNLRMNYRKKKFEKNFQKIFEIS